MRSLSDKQSLFRCLALNRHGHQAWSRRFNLSLTSDGPYILSRSTDVPSTPRHPVGALQFIAPSICPIPRSAFPNWRRLAWIKLGESPMEVAHSRPDHRQLSLICGQEAAPESQLRLLTAMSGRPVGLWSKRSRYCRPWRPCLAIHLALSPADFKTQYPARCWVINKTYWRARGASTDSLSENCYFSNVLFPAKLNWKTSSATLCDDEICAKLHVLTRRKFAKQ